jgi:hypothetical protein
MSPIDQGSSESQREKGVLLSLKEDLFMKINLIKKV